MTGQPVKAMPSHGQQRALLFHVWQSTMRVRSSSTTVRSAEAPSAITPSPCLGYHAEPLPLLGKQRGGRARHLREDELERNLGVVLRAVVEQHRGGALKRGDAERSFLERLVLLVHVPRRVVGDYRVDRAVYEALPERALVLDRAERRVDLEARIVAAADDGVLVEREVMEGRVAGDVEPRALRAPRASRCG